MTWTKLSDDFADRPAMLETSRSARLLLVELLVWSNKHLTDGRVPRRALPRLTDSENLQADLEELQQAGLVKVEDDAYQVDWSDQESAEVVRRRRDDTARRQKAYRERKAATRRVTRDVTDDVTGVVTAPRPDPSRPEGSRDGDADAPPVRELRCTVCSRPESACRTADAKARLQDRHEFAADQPPRASAAPRAQRAAS